MKLYKFRSLGDCQSWERAEEILETRQFWCSRFWDLNDPMEGVYRFTKGQLGKDAIEILRRDKAQHPICSFSGAKAIGNPTMWGYYANGFRGIAIEIEVDDECRLKKMTYADCVPELGSDDFPVERILTTKLDCWEHEDEYRFITNARTPGLHRIGRISGVYFGHPYRMTVNAGAVERESELSRYLKRRKTLIECAESQSIACHDVVMEGCKVRCPTAPFGVIP